MKDLRKLNAKDLFRMANILNKIGISELKKIIDTDKLANLASKQTINGDAMASLIGANVVFDIVGLIVSNLEKAEKDIFSFVASIIESDVKEVEKMDMSEFMDVLVAIVKKEEFKDFFNHLSMFVKSE